MCTTPVAEIVLPVGVMIRFAVCVLAGILNTFPDSRLLRPDVWDLAVESR
jgi:hypothetical protein